MAKFHCKCCDYSTEYKQVFQRHLDCKKHKEQERESIKDKGVDVYLLVDEMKKQNEILKKQNEILVEKINKQDAKITDFCVKIQEKELKMAEKEAKINAKIQEKELKMAEKEAKMNAKLVEMDAKMSEKEAKMNAKFQVKLAELEAKYDKKEHSMKQKFINLEMKLMKQKPNRVKVCEKKEEEKAVVIPPTTERRPYLEKPNNPIFKIYNDMSDLWDNSQRTKSFHSFLETFYTGKSDHFYQLVIDVFEEGKRLSREQTIDIVMELMKGTPLLDDKEKQILFVSNSNYDEANPSDASLYYYTHSQELRPNCKYDVNCWNSRNIGFITEDILCSLARNIKFGLYDNKKAVINFLEELDVMKDTYAERDEFNRLFLYELRDWGHTHI